MNHSSLTDFDSQIAAAIADEVSRQEAHVELIASENYASRAVMEAHGGTASLDSVPGRTRFTLRLPLAS